MHFPGETLSLSVCVCVCFVVAVAVAVAVAGSVFWPETSASCYSLERGSLHRFSDQKPPAIA